MEESVEAASHGMPLDEDDDDEHPVQFLLNID
jgi:hypothetical protein